jgi:hypothetical protein
MFDATQCRVEPAERPATDGRAGLISHGRRDAPAVEHFVNGSDALDSGGECRREAGNAANCPWNIFVEHSAW